MHRNLEKIIKILVILFLSCNGNDGENGNGGEKPTPPSPCTNSECVAYCRLVGAETGTCSGEDCSCSGCESELCAGYCYWWENGKEIDAEACTSGGCTCVSCIETGPCSSSCNDVCSNAREYPEPRDDIPEYFSYSRCKDGICSLQCGNSACDSFCGDGIWGRCEENECLCGGCVNDICNEWCVAKGEGYISRPPICDVIVMFRGTNGSCQDDDCTCFCNEVECLELCSELGYTSESCFNGDGPFFGYNCLCDLPS